MAGEPECFFCGLSIGEAKRGPRCAVCGMVIPRGHWPHIMRFEPDREVLHFCGLTCLDNYDASREAIEDG